LVCRENRDAGAIVRSQASAIDFYYLKTRGPDLIDKVTGNECSVSKTLTPGEKRSLLLFKSKWEKEEAEREKKRKELQIAPAPQEAEVGGNPETVEEPQQPAASAKRNSRIEKKRRNKR